MEAGNWVNRKDNRNEEIIQFYVSEHLMLVKQNNIQGGTKNISTSIIKCEYSL